MAMSTRELIKNGSTVTVTITLAGLASATTANARQSTYVDLGSERDTEYIAVLRTRPAAAPTALRTVDVYAAFSTSTATNSFPGGVTGQDTSYTGPSGNIPHGVAQLTYVGALSACATAIGQLQHVGVFRPNCRYVSFVVVNNLDQGLHTDSSEHSLTIIPIIRGAETTS